MAKEKAEQLRRFTDAARALGADVDEASFRAKLAVIARQKPNDPATSQEPGPQDRPAAPKRPSGAGTSQARGTGKADR